MNVRDHLGTGKACEDQRKQRAGVSRIELQYGSARSGRCVCGHFGSASQVGDKLSGYRGSGAGAVVVSDGDGGRRRRDQTPVGGITECQVNGLAAFRKYIVDDQHAERAAGLARREGESAAGDFVISQLTGRAIAGSKIHGRGPRSIAHAIDGDDCAAATLAHVVVGGAELHRRRRRRIDGHGPKSLRLQCLKGIAPDHCGLIADKDTNFVIADAETRGIKIKRWAASLLLVIDSPGNGQIMSEG